MGDSFVPSGSGAGAPPVAIRVGSTFALAAAERLVSQDNLDLGAAAARLVEGAVKHGIDFNLCWATLAGSPPTVAQLESRIESTQGSSLPPVTVSQTVLAVIGAGRTAMLFISDPPRAGDRSAQRALLERKALIEEACRVIGEEKRGEVAIAQALPDPREHWNVDALRAAGFQEVGRLTYLRRDPKPGEARHRNKPPAVPQPSDWPFGVRIVTVADVDPSVRDDLMVELLNSTYVDTLDCPELCGLRDTRDILESHKATGVFEPTLWWILYQGDQPVGCCLFNKCPEQRTVELVYLGLAPAVRGRGFAKRLLEHAMQTVRMGPGGLSGSGASSITGPMSGGLWSVTCAVDTRNVPAQKLYQRAGFVPFATRLAFIRAV